MTRIGGHDAIPVDVRIICATNKDLYSEMRTGSFRNDLYYRLNVINIKNPPLRERRGDIMLLFNHFMKMAERKANKKSSRISGDVQKHLINYSWPGNVRELQNVVERMVNVMSGSSWRRTNCRRISRWLSLPSHHTMKPIGQRKLQ